MVLSSLGLTCILTNPLTAAQDKWGPCCPPPPYSLPIIFYITSFLSLRPFACPSVSLSLTLSLAFLSSLFFSSFSLLFLSFSFQFSTYDCNSTLFSWYTQDCLAIYMCVCVCVYVCVYVCVCVPLRLYEHAVPCGDVAGLSRPLRGCAERLSVSLQGCLIKVAL